MKHWSAALLAPALLAALAAPALACGDSKSAAACGNCQTTAGLPVVQTKAAGTQAALVTETFTVTGMKCAKCANFVSGALLKVPGVQKVEVTAAKHSAVVTFAKGSVDAPKLDAALKGHFKLTAGAPAADMKAGEAACETEKPAEKAPVNSDNKH